MKKIFITGSGGLVGSDLVKGFVSLNYSVHALDIEFREILNLKNLYMYKTNLKKFFKSKNVKKFDYFIHAASITNPKKHIYKKNLVKNNISTTINSLLLAKKMKINKFFFISSTAVYGNYKRAN